MFYIDPQGHILQYYAIRAVDYANYNPMAVPLMKAMHFAENTVQVLVQDVGLPEGSRSWINVPIKWIPEVTCQPPPPRRHHSK